MIWTVKTNINNQCDIQDPDSPTANPTRLQCFIISYGSNPNTRSSESKWPTPLEAPNRILVSSLPQIFWLNSLLFLFSSEEKKTNWISFRYLGSQSKKQLWSGNLNRRNVQVLERGGVRIRIGSEGSAVQYRRAVRYRLGFLGSLSWHVQGYLFAYPS